MEEREFKNKKELLDFVLTECGDMEYSLVNSEIFEPEGYPFAQKLTLKNFTNGKYILYADELYFKYKIVYLFPNDKPIS